MDIPGEIRKSFSEGSVITRLIYVNLAIFLIFRVTEVLFFLAGSSFDAIRWFELPSGFAPFIQQPWSLGTYMFLHHDFLHILFNLLVLYWFGRIFLDYYSQDQLLGLYLVGGVIGGLTYMAGFNLFPVFSSIRGGTLLLGASASVLAILIASAVRDPNRGIMLFLVGTVRLKYLALFLILSYIIGISTSNAGGNLAHLGGGAAGWLFTAWIGRGTDITGFVPRVRNLLAGTFKPREKVRIVYRQPPRDDHEYNRRRAADQEELNRILDKIGNEGYETLTRQEKETLFRHGK